MAHKSFAFALLIGLAALPLACGDDDDDTGGAAGGGSGGKGGSSTTAGSAGKGGTGGKGGTSGTAGKGGTSGSDAGGEGGSGTGNTGNTGGEPVGGTAGAGGAGDGGAGGEGVGGGEAGGGGQGGAGEDPAVARLEKLRTLCAMDVYPVFGETDPPAGQCDNHVDSNCGEVHADMTGHLPSCIAIFDSLLDCALTAPQEDFFCDQADATGFEGKIGFDALSPQLGGPCPEYDDYIACKPQAQP
jgi:hypothetical protein